MDYKDYYQILGVGKSASTAEIKKAYRKLARKYHPDVNPGDAAAESHFKDINEANEVLSDTEKRQKYDRFGSEWQRFGSAGGNAQDFNWGRWGAGSPGAGRTQTVSPEEFAQMFGSGGTGGFSDFFETLFGSGTRSSGTGFGFNPATGTTRMARGQDMEHDVEITLDESDLEITPEFSSGPGGQHMQKNATAARIVHKPSGLMVKIQSERSLTQNKRLGMAIFTPLSWHHPRFKKPWI